MSTIDRDTGTMVVEWAPFRLAAGATEASLLEASDRIQREFLERQRGFVRRELLRGEDGRWADFLVWTDERSAMEAMRAAEASAACSSYFHLLEGVDGGDPGAGVQHLRRVRLYAPSDG